jgi:hypothetical protein
MTAAQPRPPGSLQALTQPSSAAAAEAEQQPGSLPGGVQAAAKVAA